MSQSFPLISTSPASVDAQFTLGRIVLRVTFDRHDVDGFRFMRVHCDGKPKIRRQVTTDFVPAIACVITAHHIPVFLHEQHIRMCTMHGNGMHAMTYFSAWVRKLIIGL